jgi:hypothetical protein
MTMTEKRPPAVINGARRLATMLAGAALICAGAMAAGPAALASQRPAWLAAPAAASGIGGTSNLRGVYCTSASSCWAVGSYEVNGGFRNETLRLRNGVWKLVTAPNPGGLAIGATNQLIAVRCTAPTNCWAVGFYTKHEIDLIEALRWNGTKWSLVATPDPGGKLTNDFNQLVDVSCSSASNCWAAGNYGRFSSTSSETLNLALHWNGTSWSQVTTPNPAHVGNGKQNQLAGIRCTSTTSCWAVGDYGKIYPSTQLSNEVLHWNGKKWSQASVPNPAGTMTGAQNVLNGLSCTSASNCWAAGAATTTTATTLNELLRWNGMKWSKTTVPDPDGSTGDSSNVLDAISCSAASNCLATGDLGTIVGTGYVTNQALFWNGHLWSDTATPNPGGTADGDFSELRGVRCQSATACFAVGHFTRSGHDDRQQILFWNGKKWQTT